MAQVNLKQLEAFVQVADLGSFRRAAEKLHTTQPNISTRISGLETQLGVKLMDRDAGSVRLTPKGAELLPYARQVIRSHDEFLVAAGDDALFEGVLRLGVTEMVVHSWLGAYLSGLKDRFPNIDIDLTVDVSANLSDALFSRSIDLALQSGPFSRQTSGAIELGSFPMIWVGAPDLGIGQRVLSLRDLAANPILTHARGTLPFEQLKDHIAAAPDVSVRLVPSTNMSACIQMTVEGLGVACLPEVMVRKEIVAGDLVPLRYLWCPDELSFQARYDADASPHYVAEAAALAGQVSDGDLSAG
ncbi:LysR family transcriptional regulator [Falsiphaeobacter marinintestinus]|uniref:LysR family transcriptional regulator n=1 Tax=Falsiphaeobacter marinintestinus TaxID=1492905 RepID=UPI0011B51ECD|nr:LysR family transcriptional regulator [Phaeobacter marinintestinus]